MSFDPNAGFDIMPSKLLPKRALLLWLLLLWGSELRTLLGVLPSDREAVLLPLLLLLLLLPWW